jgi:hypothetical protein
MGCCAGGHGDHHSENSEHEHSRDRVSRDAKNDVIDLRDDEYTIMTPEHQGLPPGQGVNMEKQDL